MKRMSIEEFKARVANTEEQVSAAAAAYAETERDKTLKRLECSKAGVATLAGAAILDLAFADFPPSIDLSAANGHNAGLSARRTGETWRLDGKLGVLRTAATYSFGSGHMHDVVHRALKAMGVPHSQEAYRELSGYLKLSPTDDEAFEQVARRLPKHTVAAILGLGSEAVRALGLEWKDQKDFFDTAFTVAARLGIDVTASPAMGVAPPLAGLAAKGETNLIRFALESGYLRTNASEGAYGAALAAVAHGHLETLKELKRHGERLDGVDQYGDTLLHAAARLLRSQHPEAAAPMAAYLIGEGVDPSAQDASGRTALEAATRYVQEDDEDSDVMKAASERFEEAVSAPSRHAVR